MHAAFQRVSFDKLGEPAIEPDLEAWHTSRETVEM
jgi:hypothetical protein